jgi:hypothetical protein
MRSFAALRTTEKAGHAFPRLQQFGRKSCIVIAGHTAPVRGETLFGAMDAANGQQIEGRFTVHCPQ